MWWSGAKNGWISVYGGGHPIRSNIQLQNDMNSFLNFIPQSDPKSFRDTRRKIRRAETKILVGVWVKTDNYTKSYGKKTFFFGQNICRARAHFWRKGQIWALSVLAPKWSHWSNPEQVFNKPLSNSERFDTTLIKFEPLWRKKCQKIEIFDFKCKLWDVNLVEIHKGKYVKFGQKWPKIKILTATSPKFPGSVPALQ